MFLLTNYVSMESIVLFYMTRFWRSWNKDGYRERQKESEREAERVSMILLLSLSPHIELLSMPNLTSIRAKFSKMAQMSWSRFQQHRVRYGMWRPKSPIVTCFYRQPAIWPMQISEMESWGQESTRIKSAKTPCDWHGLYTHEHLQLRRNAIEVQLQAS